MRPRRVVRPPFQPPRLRNQPITITRSAATATATATAPTQRFQPRSLMRHAHQTLAIYVADIVYSGRELDEIAFLLYFSRLPCKLRLALLHDLMRADQWYQVYRRGPPTPPPPSPAEPGVAQVLEANARLNGAELMVLAQLSPGLARLARRSMSVDYLSQDRPLLELTRCRGGPELGPRVFNPDLGEWTEGPLLGERIFYPPLDCWIPKAGSERLQYGPLSSWDNYYSGVGFLWRLFYTSKFQESVDLPRLPVGGRDSGKSISTNDPKNITYHFRSGTTPAALPTLFSPYFY